MFKYKKIVNEDFGSTIYKLVIFKYLGFAIGYSTVVSNSLTFYIDLYKLSLQFSLHYFVDSPRDIVNVTGGVGDA